MSAVPNVRNLVEALKTLDEGVRAQASLDRIVDGLLPQLLPEVRAARVYRIAGSQAVPSADGAGEFTIVDSPLHHSALLWLEPYGEGARWAVPLTSRGRAFALLDIECPTAPEDLDEFAGRLRLIAHLLAPAAENSLAGTPAPRTSDDSTIIQEQVEASSAIFRSGDPIAVLQTIVRFTGRQYSHAHLALGDDAADPFRFHVVAEFEGDFEQAAGRYVQLEDYPSHESLLRLETVCINDAGNIDGSAPARAAWLILPLSAGGQMTGLISLSHDEPVTLAASRLRALRSLADQAAVILENNRLLADSEQRARQLQHIARFSQALQDTLDVEAIVTTMLNETLQIIQVDRMNIALYDPILGALRLVAQYENGRSRITPTGGALLHLQGAFIGQVWESGEFLVLNDVYGAEDIRRISVDEVRSLMIAPLWSQGRKLGLVSAGSVHLNAFQETDVAAFQQMVNQLAAALGNAETYARSQRKATNEAFVNALSTRLEKQLDIRQMLDITLRELGTTLGARRGRIRLSTESTGSPAGPGG